LHLFRFEFVVYFANLLKEIVLESKDSKAEYVVVITGINIKKCKFLNPKVRLCIVIVLTCSKQLLYRAGLWDPRICTSLKEYTYNY
jgi:hypothetical protein